jgi:hypothetical protein
MNTQKTRRNSSLGLAWLLLLGILVLALHSGAPGAAAAPFTGGVLSQVDNPLTTVVNWFVIASGGGPATSGSIATNSTLGQAVIGVSTSGTVAINSAGYWQPSQGAAPGACSLSAAKSGNDVVLSWTAASGATEYRVYRDTTPYFTPGAPYASTASLSYTDVGVIGDPALNHYYLVGATNVAGETLCDSRMGEFDFALSPGADLLNDIALPLDASASGLANAEMLATWIELDGGAPFGSVRQLLKWDAFLGNFLAWSHEFGFGDNFPLFYGDYIFLVVTPDAPTLASFVGRVPTPGEVAFPLAPGAAGQCALNFLSLPFDQAQITTADQLSDAIGTPDVTVVQALDWDSAIQNFLAWSNEFGFGDNFPTTIGHPYIVCLSDQDVPEQWP